MPLRYRGLAPRLYVGVAVQLVPVRAPFTRRVRHGSVDRRVDEGRLHQPHEELENSQLVRRPGNCVLLQTTV